MRSFLAITLFALAAIAFAREGQAAFSYTTPYSTYTQNFDSLPNTPTNASVGASPLGWTDDNASPGAGNFSIVGWYLRHPIGLGAAGEGGFNQNQRMRFGNGSSNVGSFYSYGTNASTDRALGSLSSNTLATASTGSQLMALRITNSTGARLTSFELSYFGEQWRDGGATVPNAQSLVFEYSLNAGSINDGLATFSPVPALNFTSPTFTNVGGGAALDGNDSSLPTPINRIGIGTVTVSGINWAAGTDIWLRWSDLNNAGNDHGLAIDDLSFRAATPEPESFLVWGCLALIGFACLRRFQ